ncbi:hypothetical protein HW132_13500 [Brasilonema sp. CT11]|nr:hypothetical protein [Brasilonema sp. CT11]
MSVAIQEYLTAQYIDDHRQIEKLVTQHLTDKRWKELFLLVAGLMRGGADDLLLLMEKEAQKYINTPKLQALLNWAEQATTGSAGDLKPVGKRAFAIANAKANVKANVKAYADACAKAIADAYPYADAGAIAIADVNTIDFADAIANAIIYTPQLEDLKIFNNINYTMLIDELNELKNKIPDEKQPLEVRRRFVQRLQQTLLNAFNLSPDIINLFEEEAKALENYLYANNLLIQCKQASVRVSPQTWEKIEARMLLVPSN